jgi:tetratricopeptide (TPR) repeat protein
LIRKAILLVVLASLYAGCSTTSTPPPRAGSQLLLDADRAMLQEQYAKAASLFEQFLSENPHDAQRAEVRMQAGKCRLGAGTPDLAVRSFDQALGEQPVQSVKWEILFRRAIAYRMLGDSGRSLEGFRAVALAPFSAPATSRPARPSSGWSRRPVLTSACCRRAWA